MIRSLRNKVLSYAKMEYNTVPDHPWVDAPDNDVLRHSDTRKWYGLIFPVAREKLAVSGVGDVDILNVKCNPEMGIHLRKQDGILPAYHMNHTQWLSVLLDGTVSLKMICNLIDISYDLTLSKRKRKLLDRGGKSG